MRFSDLCHGTRPMPPTRVDTTCQTLAWTNKTCDTTAIFGKLLLIKTPAQEPCAVMVVKHKATAECGESLGCPWPEVLDPSPKEVNFDFRRPPFVSFHHTPPPSRIWLLHASIRPDDSQFQLYLH